MHLLRIDSSVRVENSKTRTLTDFFLQELGKYTPFSLVRRDVGLNPPPPPNDEFVKANYTPPTNRTEQMNETLKTSDELINELLNADKIVMASPMYNFSIPASLKAYIDNIVRVGRTFTLGEDGAMNGLLGEKKILIITSRGAMSYKEDGVLAAFDFQEGYLNALCRFLGITAIQFVHTEAQDFGKEELKDTNFEQAKKELRELAKVW